MEILKKKYFTLHTEDLGRVLDSVRSSKAETKSADVASNSRHRLLSPCNAIISRSLCLRQELGGNFEKVIVNSLQAAEEEYDPEYHTDDKMKVDAESLYKMGQGTSEASEPCTWVCCSIAGSRSLFLLDFYQANSGRMKKVSLLQQISLASRVHHRGPSLFHVANPNSCRHRTLQVAMRLAAGIPEEVEPCLRREVWIHSAQSNGD
jgi:hypothetical protein